MACVSSLITSIGISAIGGLSGNVVGQALGNTGIDIASKISNVAGVQDFTSVLTTMSGVATGSGSVADLVTASLNPLEKLTAGILPDFETVAASIGGGALSGALGADFSTGLSGLANTFGGALSKHTGDLFGDSPIQMIQAMGMAEGFASTSAAMAGPYSNALTQSFGKAISSINGALPIDGNFGNFLGDAIPNLNATVNNGLTNFMSNASIPNFAEDLSNLGSSFDLGDISNFGNLGQVADNLLKNGAGDITGLTQAFEEVNFDAFGDVVNLSNPEFNDILGNAMSRITNPEMIADAQKMLGSNIPNLTSMADFGDLSKVLPTSFSSIIPDNFDEFRTELQSIDLGSMSTPKQFGDLLTNLKMVDLPNISEITNVVDPDAALQVAAKFLGGTGPNGAVTVSDIMGTVGGIGINTESIIYETAMEGLENNGAFATTRAIFSELSTGIAGGYTTGDGAYDTDTINDPRGGNHDDLDAFVTAKKAQLETAFADIFNDSSISGTVANATTAYTAMQRKLLTEKNLFDKIDMHLDLRNDDPQNAFNFVSDLQQKATDDRFDLIKGMIDSADDNKFRDYMDAALAEAKNITFLQDFGINPRTAEIIEL